MKIGYLLFFYCLGTSVFSQSRFVSNLNLINNRNNVVESITASISYQGYDETQGYFGQGEYEIFLDHLNGILDKPVIILDGFDPGDTRNISVLYNSMTFDGNNMLDILRDEGFDIVILNSPQYTTNGMDIDGGSDYIQRNAMVLIELINTINAQKVGDQELAIMGLSMGGLITRYALSFMEANSMDHQTRLYLSFDAPHKGANVPIALQYIINYFAVSLGNTDAQDVLSVLNTPAAKQMLIDHYSSHLLSGSTFEQDPTKLTPDGAPDFRDAFDDELEALGFPESVRNVAIVNGSGMSLGIGSPGMEIIDTTLDVNTTLTADVALHFMPEATQTITLTNLETFLVGLPIDSFSANGESLSTSDGVDSAPGGSASISGLLGDGGGNSILEDFIMALQQNEYSFIPVISALAIENENNWYATPNIGGVHDSGFVNTFVPDNNQPHVSITQENAQFAMDEIRGDILGVDEFFTWQFKLLKNPVSDQIQLELHPNAIGSTVTLTIHSLSGQQVLRVEKIGKKRMSIHHSLPSGLYLVTMKSNNTNACVKLLVE